MKRVFKYRFSRRTLYLSAFYILVLALIGLGLHSLYIGGYLSAWFVSLVVALFALMSLSIPRKIVVKKATVEILCLLDMTEIPPRGSGWRSPPYNGSTRGRCGGSFLCSADTDSSVITVIIST